jgi:hypothetical protein
MNKQEIIERVRAYEKSEQWNVKMYTRYAKEYAKGGVNAYHNVLWLLERIDDPKTPFVGKEDEICD